MRTRKRRLRLGLLLGLLVLAAITFLSLWIWLVTGPPQDRMRYICYITAALPLGEEN